MSRLINITVDGLEIEVEQLDDGTFRRPAYLTAAEREVVGRYTPPSGKAWNLAADKASPGDGGTMGEFGLRSASMDVTAPATDDARRWQGWGTSLKPAHEPVVVARRPLAGTVAATVLAHGTGALNIAACRTVAGQDYRDKCASVVGLDSNRNGDAYGEWTGTRADSAHAAGRWPTNVILTHQPLVDDTGNIIGDACADGCVPGCPVADMDAQSGIRPSGGSPGGVTSNTGMRGNTFTRVRPELEKDTGGASRFFPVFRYEAKAPSSERPRGADGTAHATVKPLALMRWLVRLVTPPGGTVLDPFLGSGTTAEACLIEGFRCIGIERDEAHLPLITARLAKPIQPTLGFEDTA